MIPRVVKVLFASGKVNKTQMVITRTHLVVENIYSQNSYLQIKYLMEWLQHRLPKIYVLDKNN